MELPILGQFILAVFTVTVWRHLTDLVPGGEREPLGTDTRSETEGLPGDGRAEID